MSPGLLRLWKAPLALLDEAERLQDLTAEFRKLPEDKRQQGDRFSLITVVIPAAMWIVRLSLTDPSAAVSAGRRVATACRHLSDDEWLLQC